jgi:hypothetical protein
MSHKNIQQLQQKIEEIQEYIETELCKKCEDMRLQLIALKHIADQYDNPDNTRELDPSKD